MKLYTQSPPTPASTSSSRTTKSEERRMKVPSAMATIPWHSMCVSVGADAELATNEPAGM